MANKLQYVSQLADQTAKAVTRNAGGWKNYLNTASRLYKYSFDEQLLIYAQRLKTLAFTLFKPLHP